MLWEVEIHSKLDDTERRRVVDEYDLLTHTRQGAALVVRSARSYLLHGEISLDQAERLARDLLVDPLAESGRVHAVGADNRHAETAQPIVHVLLKPGVMDPVAQSVVEAARDLGIRLESVRTLRRYHLSREPRDPALRKVLANEAIEQIVEGPLTAEHLTLGSPYAFRLVTVPLRDLVDAELEGVSRDGQLSLNPAEMRAIRDHFRGLGRDPTDVELETLAQTWSEHCSHKTLKGKIDLDGRRIDNLLKETIFGATQEIRRRLGAADWCVSVFEDNAGVVRFDDRYHVCFKVETHNHPSAIEPYGGANTGLGGVIRDPLGTGLGARPVCNTDVFCFAPPDTPPEALPPGVLHPKKVMRGVVAGVRDYGNRMGIPTVNGAVCFDERYLGNPLVFCGTVGLIPVERCRKEARAGDLIVVVGGRTGRDGIHGATFSSAELTSGSEKISGGAVQIGNAITEKKLLDVLLQARDGGLYHAITDCGAGGLSSAVGEMGEKLGAVVHLDRAPLKYEGLSYTEIWISEAQERMVLAVPPGHWPALEALCSGEDVEATAIGAFEATGKLRLNYQAQQVADLDMNFLHHGRPPVVRQATDVRPAAGVSPVITPVSANLTDDLLKILSSLNVCSKEWIIRQYDHEVQGGSVVKPLVGAREDGPGDAAVIAPVLGSWRGLAIGCGINPRYGDLDPYCMAAAAVDEAVRNVVAVGADPSRIALLDNFCWGNTDRPEVLGSLVRAAEACRDVALAYGTPFISGKDSLNNEYHSAERHITIPPTLLISALGQVPDVCRCVTMDVKEAGNLLFLIGLTRDDMGGSHYNLIHGIEGGVAPVVDLDLAPRVFHRLHEAIRQGLLRACHDLSEGGLAVALAEMAFAGGLGMDVTGLGDLATGQPDVVVLFSESTTRFVVEVRPHDAEAFQRCLGDQLPLARIGTTCPEPRLRVAGTSGEWVIWAELADLKEAWQRPLRW
ncbi:MAG TPA: phosphoribosylformylglycinamidine synthase subunit PurL [Gemmataceae bacterium]|jgi:phosphoribosylformylglycinamidine synthase|nr:phosphoribosylformylglycinamidine synthase subunit PurL [Gemmataceae bacterium]